MNQDLVASVAIGFAILLLFYLLYSFVMSYKKQKKIKREEEDIGVSIKVRKELNLIPFYFFFYDFAPTRNFIIRLQHLYEMQYPDDNKFVLQKTASLALKIFFADAVIILVCLLMRPSLYIILVMLYTVYVVSDQIVLFVVQKNDNRILVMFNEFISNVRFYYFDCDMIDEAIEMAMERSPSIMQLHAAKILTVLRSQFLEDEVLDYNDMIPNNFMRNFLAMAVTVVQYGDKKIESGESLFLANLKNLKKEINLELTNRKNINHKFALLIPISVVPVYVLPAISNWATSQLVELENYYNGAYGTIVVCITFVSSFISYLLVKRLRFGRGVDLSNHALLSTFVTIPFVEHIINSYENKNYGKTLEIRDILKRTGVHITSQMLLAKRFIYMVFTFIVVLILSVVITTNTKNSHVNNFTSIGSSANGATEKYSVMMLLLADYYLEEYKNFNPIEYYNKANPDKPVTVWNEEVTEAFKGMFLQKLEFEQAKVTIEQAIDATQQYAKVHKASKLVFLQIPTDISPNKIMQSKDENIQKSLIKIQEVQEDSNRIKGLAQETLRVYLAEELVSRIQKYQNTYFKFLYLLIAAGVASLAYQFPMFLMNMQRAELQAEMESEVIQFQTIIMMLMYIDRMTIDVILEWMQLLSYVFEPSIQTCINELAMSPDNALEHLAENEPYEPFRRLVENLQKIDRVGIKNAFNEINVERANYQENRRVTDEIKVSNNAASALLLSYVPASVVMFGYLVGPFLIESIRQTTLYMSEINGAL